MKILLLLSLAFLLCSCTIGTVQWNLRDEQFKNETLPVRELRVALLNGSIYSKETIQKTFRTSSERMVAQAGISLKIVHYEEVDIPLLNRVSFKKMGDSMMRKLRPMEKDFDVGLLVTFYTAPGYLWAQAVGSRMGMCEDTYRRYIIIKELSTYSLEHELWHCFVLESSHGISGILMPGAFRVLPLTPVIPVGGMYLTTGAREEALKYKWRDFNKQVTTILNEKKQFDPYVDFSRMKTNDKR